jgi:hypothetical protein
MPSDDWEESADNWFDIQCGCGGPAKAAVLAKRVLARLIPTKGTCLIGSTSYLLHEADLILNTKGETVSRTTGQEASGVSPSGKEEARLVGGTHTSDPILNQEASLSRAIEKSEGEGAGKSSYEGASESSPMEKPPGMSLLSLAVSGVEPRGSQGQAVPPSCLDSADCGAHGKNGRSSDYLSQGPPVEEAELGAMHGAGGAPSDACCGSLGQHAEEAMTPELESVWGQPDRPVEVRLSLGWSFTRGLFRHMSDYLKLGCLLCWLCVAYSVRL